MKLGALAPTSIADVFIRALKTAVFTFIGVMGSTVTNWTNLDAVKAGGIVALTAGAAIIINFILSWANTPTP
jgi:hypothetical protein